MTIFDHISRNDIERSLKKIADSKKSISKKINKLQRNPELFFKDMYTKRTKQLIAKIPIKYVGKNQFTVISAVYNVERYLDDYFKSLVNQSLDFKKHIQIILVDDGSTDSSAQIIKKWQKKYPNNIRYFYKENGGQASARDYGIDFIETKWCTFIDPDDFVDVDYFKNIDSAIEEQQDLWMVSCNLIYFYEQSKQYKDNHPQNYKFKQKITCFDVKDSNQFIQLSVSLAILNTQVIKENNLRFDTRIKPSFEDATFMMHYALALYQKHGRVAFIKDAKYYYRKREDGTSTLDTGWIKPSGYDEVLRYGCLQTLKDYKEALGYVPKFIQTSVMYYHIWQLRKIVNNEETVNFLSYQQKETFVSLLKEIFSYIDEDTIYNFNLAETRFDQKVGMLTFYKGISINPDYQSIYIEKFDKHKNQVLVYYFADEKSQASFYDNGVIIKPSFSKIRKHSFLDYTFMNEYRFWLPLEEKSSITAMVNGNKTKIYFQDERHSRPIKFEEIKVHYTKSKYPIEENFWILMDRINQADDNAEHFYHYMMTKYPKQKIYFALSKESHDWERLQKGGFNLLQFGSSQFETLLKNCSKIISSHIDDWILNYFKDGGLRSKDFIFLPHGVTQNDFHQWYNSKIQSISMITLSTKDEYKSIAEDGNHYKYSKKEIKLTGFPRHDSLFKGNQQNCKRIVVMPTWRKYLLKGSDSQTGKWSKDESFIQSTYFNCWQSFLISEKLKVLMEKYGYGLVFAPHVNLESYLSDFDIPEYINIWKPNPNESIQNLFQKSDIMITDYSSVAFEMSYLGKPVLYYQFDFDDAFKGHLQKGYFEYEKHGFGAVSTEESQLLADLEDILANDGKALPEYQTRIDNTFAYRDDKNCERVYQAIKELDEPSRIDIDLDYINQSMEALYQNKNWELAQKHSEFLLSHTIEQSLQPEKQKLAIHILFTSLYMQSKYEEVVKFAKTYMRELNSTDKAAYYYLLSDWENVIALLKDKADYDKSVYSMLLHSYAELGRYQEIAKLSKYYQFDMDSREVTIYEQYERVLSLLNKKDWKGIISELENNLPNGQEYYPFLQTYKLELLLARAYRELKLYNSANEQLVNYEKHTRNDSKCHLEIARLAFELQNYDKTISQYEQACFGYLDDLSLSDNYYYIDSLLKTNKLTALNEILPTALAKQPNSQDLLFLEAKRLIVLNKWQDFLTIYQKLSYKNQKAMKYFATLSKYRLGQIDEAYKEVSKPTHENDYEYWLLVMEIAFMKEDVVLAKYCYQHMIAIYPDKATESSNNFKTMLENYELMQRLTA